jgi:hypothetical protein
VGSSSSIHRRIEDGRPRVLSVCRPQPHTFQWQIRHVAVTLDSEAKWPGWNMLTAAFAARLQLYGVTVNAGHQGDVNSRLRNDLGFGGQTTLEEGADTPVWLATESVGPRETGKDFEQRRAESQH